jgi:hypothetical protein
VALDSWLITEPRLAPVLSVVTVRAVTSVLGSETVDDLGEEAADSTLGSKGSFSSGKLRCKDRSRASSFTASVAQLRRWERRVARSIGIPMEE